MASAPRAASPTENYEIAAYAVIARPPDIDQWKSLQASLRQEHGSVRLATSHCVPIPAGVCPWCEELRILTDVRQRLMNRHVATAEERRHSFLSAVNQRLEFLIGSASAPNAGLDTNLFLCSAVGDTGKRNSESITPNSLFGERLREASAYAAVATAVHAIREEASHTHGPRTGRTWSWRVHKIINAYHDPLLQASFLRCVRPSELLAIDRSRTRDAVDGVLFPAEDPALRQSALLAAEHAFAALIGKYPIDLRSDVHVAADRVLNQWASPVRTILEAMGALGNGVA